VFNNWILDIEAWFDDKLFRDDDKVSFSKLKFTRLAKLLVADFGVNQNLVTTWMGLMEALSVAFYPSKYKHDMNIKWIFLHQGFNMPVQQYIQLFNRL
jgi:hypothetical protein